jgi:hypothetical protein
LKENADADNWHRVGTASGSKVRYFLEKWRFRKLSLISEIYIGVVGPLVAARIERPAKVMPTWLRLPHPHRSRAIAGAKAQVREAFLVDAQCPYWPTTRPLPR